VAEASKNSGGTSNLPSSIPNLRFRREVLVANGPHLRDGPIVAAENNRFPGLDAGKIPGKMRLGLVHVELDHKTIILVSE